MTRSSMLVVAVLVGLCGVVPPSAAFLQDLLLQPLQHIQQAVQHVVPQQQPQQPQYYHNYYGYDQQLQQPRYYYPTAYPHYDQPQPQPQPQQQPRFYPAYQYGQQQPQYYQQTYRRSAAVAAEPQPQPQPQIQTLPAPVQHGVYSSSGARPAAYQWPQPQQPQQPQTYGSAYSYSGSNPLSSLLQGSWLPSWVSAGRQPQVQQQQQVQPLAAAPQPQQPQQPLQAFWALLPWNSNLHAGQSQQPQQPGPILSFLQNPSAVLPWGQQQAGRPVYTTPLSPAPVHVPVSVAVPASAAVAAAPVSASLTSAASAEAADAAPSVKPTGVVLDGDLPAATAAFGDNGIRRVALADVVHADGLPCAHDA